MVVNIKHAGFSSALLSELSWKRKSLVLSWLTASLISTCTNSSVYWNFHADDETWFLTEAGLRQGLLLASSRCQNEYRRNNLTAAGIWCFGLIVCTHYVGCKMTWLRINCILSALIGWCLQTVKLQEQTKNRSFEMAASCVVVKQRSLTD